MGFRRGRGITASLSEQEADLLRRLIREYLEVLSSSNDEGPVMKRLFPDASLDDEKVRVEYRELAEDDLAKHKRATADTALASLGPSGPYRGRLSEHERDSWMVLLTDLRLVLGTRLGVTEEMMSADPDPADPEQWPLAVMHYLGWLQETLVEASA